MGKHLLNQTDRDAGTIARWKGYRKLQLVCQECGTSFTVPPSVVRKGKGKYCSQKCANQAKGRAMSVERHLKTNGYVYIKTWEHPRRSKQNLIAEHRLVVEKAIGRYLTDIEVVHHINEITTDNRLSNLYLCKDDIEHRIVGHLDKTFLTMFNVARYQQWSEFEKFDITKNRQDRLQAMIIDQWGEPQKVFNMLEEFYYWADATDGVRDFTSMEQLWMAFLMKEKYGRVWNG